MPQNFNMRSTGRSISIIIHSAKFTAQFQIREMERKRERGQIGQINSSVLDINIWIIRESDKGGDISLTERNIRLKDFSIYIGSHNSCGVMSAPVQTLQLPFVESDRCDSYCWEKNQKKPKQNGEPQCIVEDRTVQSCILETIPIYKVD